MKKMRKTERKKEKKKRKKQAMASEEVGDHAVCGAASESFFGFIKREMSYVLKYQSHIDDLENQVKELGYKRQRVEHPVNNARREGDEIYKGVEQWLIGIDEFTQRVVKPIIDYQDEAKKHYFRGLCPNLLKRYNLSKEAVKAAKEVANLLGKGNFSNFCFRPAPQRIELMSSSGYQQFNSRRSIFQDIMEAMKDDKVNMIGVYGSGGVGKTTLVKAVARQVMEEKLFDEVVMVEVTRTPDQKPIQDKIASDLGLQFGQHDNVLQRAAQLSERLKKEKRVLIILDNIWMRLDLDAIGIPFWGNEKQSVRQQEDWNERYVDQSRCKILLTSRNQHVLYNEMNIQKTFSIGVLSDEEAMSLFWNNVGDAAGRSDFLPIGVEIVRECGGLPIAIITIANALKNKILFFWKDAFDQLRNSNQRCIEGEDAKVYSIIELSYNFLESEEAKSLFRLCGLLNDGSQIPLDALMRCGMGLGLLKGVYTLQEARTRVHMLVNNLKASRLLLDGDAEECFKMHDIIHSIAVSVATKKLMFNMQNVADLKEELNKKTHKDPTAISIPFRGIYEFPERLECPKLKLFILFSENLSLQIPDLFFEGMTELRVLSFTGFCFPSLPSSVGCLISLRTLTLESCLLGEVATIGYLKKLEILSLRHSDFEQLPEEIGQLTRLKLLDLSNCTKLKVIRPNVISSLSRLEELYMGNSFTQWEIEGQSNASLVELKQLWRLTTLEIHIPDAQVMPQDLLSVELERYRICVGDVWSWSGEHETSRRLKLSALDKCIYLGYGMRMLLKGIEDLYLDELNGFQNALHELDDGEGFPRLKHLHVQNVYEILYIVNLGRWGRCNAFPLLESLFLHNLMSLEKVYHGHLTEQSFSKLRIIKVYQCDRLKHLFSFSMAINLLQLQKIKVSFCESLELIVGKESGETHNVHEIINFTRLHSLTLQCLPQLTSSGFNLERPLISSTISVTTSAFEEDNEEDDSNESLFNNKVIFPNLEKLKLSSINIEKIWHDQYPLMLISCSQNLTKMTVETCSRLKFLFSYSMVDSLVRLQQLEIRKCESMEAVIDTTGFGINSIEFPSLHHLRIVDCPNLRSFISVNSLEEKILHTDMQPLFDGKVGLPCLEVLSIEMMDNMRKIWHHQLAFNSFSKLKALEVTKCGKLVHIFPANIIMRRRLERLEYLKVDGCASVEEIIGETRSNGNISMVEEEEEEVEAHRRFVFPRLTWLNLSFLPRLQSFCPGVNILEWPLLKSLGVFGCDSVEILFASPEYFSCESHRPLFLLDPKVAFPSLKELELNKLPKLLHLWKENSQLSNVLQNLATLEISECNKLEKLVPSSVSLENLTTLEVSKCNGLIHLVTLSTAESLVKLTRMNVIDCKMLQQIILHVGEEVKKDVIVFSQLKYLGLHCFPCLMSFCLGNFTLEFPCLEQVIVRECPKMKIFSQGVSHTPKLQRLHLREEYDEGLWEGSLNCTIQKLFEEMVGYHDKACLKLSDFPHLKEIWHGQALPVSFFINLRWLVVDDCRFRSGAIPASQLQYLINLKTLEVRNCYSLEQVFHLEEQNPVGQFRSLFPKLRNLKLINLPQLIRFCKFTGRIIELPFLVNLWIENCRNMKTFISCSTPVLKAASKEPLQMTSQENLPADMQPLFDEKVKLPSLEVLGISRMDNLRKIWQDQLSLDSFCKLNYLGIQHCKRLLSIFSWNMLERMQNLEKLEVFYCDSVREISELQMLDREDTHASKVAQLRETVPNFPFPHLTSMKLHSLPRLRSFYPGVHISEWPRLKNLYLSGCSRVEIFASEFLSPQEIHSDGHCDLQTQQPFFYVDKVAFPSLEELKLSNLPKLQHLWKENSQSSKVFQNLAILEIAECSKLEKLVPSSVSFENLMTVEVLKCGGLRNLVTLSTTKSLVKLTRMNVTDCKMIKEIIEQVGEEVKKDCIVFSQLKYLGFHCLPGFTCFYLGNDTFEFPSLEQAVVRQCPKMKIFCQGILSTPKLQRLQLTELEDEGCWEGNLNSTIQKLFEDMVGYRGIVYLKLSQSPHLEEIWHSKALPVSLFSSLRCLVVDDCRFMSSAIPANLRRYLNNLETLEVSNCYSLEEVFHLEELNASEHCQPLFPKLLHLKLVDLPKLMSFCSFTGSIIELPSLISLRIEKCPKMKTFISSSTPVNMAANKEPQEITSEENSLAKIQSLFDEKVKLPSLELLRISRMDSLRKIWQDQLTLGSFNKLSYLGIQQCNKLLNIFPWNMLQRLQKLEKLEVFYCESVQHISELRALNCWDARAMLLAQFRETVPSFVFPHLTSLKLRSLPRLKCFYPGVHISEWPMLKYLDISGCAKLEIFASEFLSPGETHVDTQHDSQTQRPFFSIDKVAFPSLEELRLSRLPKLFQLCKETSHPRKVFQNLATLEISECSKLDILVPSSVSFENLTTLEVSKCGRLMNLVTISTAESLVNLARMDVTDCKMIQQIIKQFGEVEKDCIVFSQLKYLGLHCLPSLKSFCMGNKTLEFPCLEKVIVRECPKMIIFSQGVLHTPKLQRLELTEEDDEGHWEGSLNSTIQKLFVEMVGFCDLKCLKLSLFPNLKEIWHGQPLPVSFYSNLRSLVVDDCMYFLSAIPANLLRSLNNLEKLEVSNCDSLEEVFHLEEPNADEHFGSLFPKLRKLKLKDLPKLIRFCNFTNDIIELPFLSYMWIENCPNMVTFVSNSTFAHLTADEAPQEMIMEENILADIQPLFDEKVGLPSLEELGLSRMDNLRKIWHDQLNLDSFCKINYLGIRNCNKLLNIFPWNMLQRLQKLRWLFVGNCDSVEEIVELQVLSDDDSCAITAAPLSETIPSCVLPQLISLTLSSLPSLKSFYPGVHISEWPMLKKLEVMECAEVQLFASEFQSPHETNVHSQRHIKIPQPLFCVDKVAFPSLEELTLCVLPGLLHLWEENSRPGKVFQNLATLKISECGKLENLTPSSVSFQNLMTLEVSKCDGLINLVTLSTVESLVKLTTMHITECMMIEEIIQEAGEAVGKDCLLFSQLKFLELHCLPSLTCFCLGNYALEFPTLEKVVVRECPKMEIFSQGVLSTPKLQRLLLTESEDEGRWEGNLNSTIQKLFEEMIGFRDINYLKLSQFPHLKEMWHGKSLPVSFFSNLSWLVVEDCTFFSSAIPVNLLRFLNNLKILEISNCDSLEEVFHLEELNANEHFEPLFPSLRKLKLKNLPKLIRFCNFIRNIIRLPSLSYMWIESCPNMTTFISNSTPVLMTANKEPPEMSLEENFLADMQPLFDEKVGLPSLEELAILSMDNLRKIWQDELSLHSFCNLKFLGVQKCNKLLNIFPCNMLERLHKLQKLQVLYCNSVREILELRALNGRDTNTIKAAPLRESNVSFVFPQLTSLSLWWLPGLKSFCPRVQISEWPMLKKLDVGGCAEVEIFASEVLSLQETHVDSQHNIQIPQSLFFVDKVAFPSLEDLRVFRLPKLLHLWKENSHLSKVFPNLASLKLSECTKLEKLVSSSVSFQNLTTLEVSKCDGLINLVTCSTAESMVKLVRMSIADCKLIEEIIHPIGENVKDCIVFSQLKYLGLHFLPSLTSFCLGNYTLEFPSLEQVIVIDCLKMMTFSQGVLHTPKVHRLQLTEEDDEGCWDGNLNNTIQQLFKRVNFQSSNDED